jgi:hypothetical protein
VPQVYSIIRRSSLSCSGNSALTICIMTVSAAPPPAHLQQLLQCAQAPGHGYEAISMPRHHGLNKQPAGQSHEQTGTRMHAQERNAAMSCKMADRQHGHAQSSTSEVTGEDSQLHVGWNEHAMHLLLCTTQSPALP